MDSLLDVVLFGALFVACYTDLTRLKIPNAITLPLVPAGILYWLLVGPWYTGLVGFAVAFPIHLLFFVAGVDKGGDAKMMMAVGALMGWAFMLEATLWSLLLFLPVGLVVLAARGRLSNLLAAVKWSFTAPMLRARGEPVPERPEPTYLARAPVLLAAVALARFTPWMESVIGTR